MIFCGDGEPHGQYGSGPGRAVHRITGARRQLATRVLLSEWRLCGRICSGGLGSVDVDELAVEAVLMKVASGCLDPARGRHAAGLPRLEAGRSDQPLDRCPGGIVVCGVEQRDP